MSQAIENAHLRPLPRCATCGKPATCQLLNGVNSPQGVYCDPHGKAALKTFKGRGTGR